MEILGLPLAAYGSEMSISFRLISTIAGLITALDLSASLGLQTLWISIPDRLCEGAWSPISDKCERLCSSSKELREEEPSECESYFGNLDVGTLLLEEIVGTSIIGSGSEGLDPVDSVSDADECPSEP